MLRKFQLLSQLSENQLQEISKICELKTYKQGETLFNEGETDRDIYFLKSGRVGLYKTEPNAQQEICFKKMDAGESFGEMSFLDGSPRSCTIKAEVDSETYILSKQKLLDKVVGSDEIVSLLRATIEYQISSYLRYLSDRHIATLQARINELEERNRFGAFVLILLAGLFLGTFLTAFLNEFWPTNFATSLFFNWFYLLVPVFAPILLAAYNMKLSVIKIGIRKKRLKRSILDGILFTGIGLLSIYGACVTLDPILPDIDLVQGFLNIPWHFSIIFYGLHSYIQEFARALIQISVKKFLKDRRGLYSVGITAVTFATTHAHFSSIVMTIAFFSSLIFSWIYMRTYNLAGVTIVHTVLGYVILSMFAVL